MVEFSKKKLIKIGKVYILPQTMLVIDITQKHSNYPNLKYKYIYLLEKKNKQRDSIID